MKFSFNTETEIKPITQSNQLVPQILKPTQHQLTTAQCYQIYGVTRSQLSGLCINMFHFPQEYRDTLLEYYILHWTGEHFCDKLEDGMVHSYGKDYLVVYQNTTPFSVRRAAQLSLSFREPKPEFGIAGYVIVRVCK